MKSMNTSWVKEIDNVEVEHVITPFIQMDEDAMTDRLIKQNGGKPIKSQLQTIREAGSNNAEATLDQIHKEDAMDLQAKQSRMNGLFESAE